MIACSSPGPVARPSSNTSITNRAERPGAACCTVEDANVIRRAGGEKAAATRPSRHDAASSRPRQHATAMFRRDVFRFRQRQRARCAEFPEIHHAARAAFAAAFMLSGAVKRVMAGAERAMCSTEAAPAASAAAEQKRQRSARSAVAGAPRRSVCWFAREAPRIYARQAPPYAARSSSSSPAMPAASASRLMIVSRAFPPARRRSRRSSHAHSATQRECPQAYMASGMPAFPSSMQAQEQPCRRSATAASLHASMRGRR